MSLTATSTAEQVIQKANQSLKALEQVVPLFIEKIEKLDKKDLSAAHHALTVIAELADKIMLRAQPYVIKALPAVLNAAGDKKGNNETRELAEKCAKAITEKISPNAIREVLPHLFAAMNPSCKWQSRVAALKAICAFGDHAPEQLGYALPEVIPEVSQCVVDLKQEVCEAAESAMVAVCDVVGNRDIEHLTGSIVRSITHPEETEELMHKLAGVTFVQSVESPALAMVVPLLIRGLNSKKTATVRQSSVIIDNMSRLVDDPLDAAPFMPLLMPVLEKAADVVSDPEARSVAERAVAQLKRLNAEVEEAQSRQQHIEHSRVFDAIKSKFNAPEADSYLSHVASLCCSLMAVRKFDKGHWKEIEQHLAIVNKEKAAFQIDKIRAECEAMAKPLPSKDELEDDGEDLCNCQFTLAYGTKILLHNTKLRLKRGGKYGLLGGNDSGKTTLMRAIANGSVEGFPDPAEVKTVFVEADILGELSHLSCVDYVMADERLQDIPRDEVLRVMATVGFTEDGKAKPNNPVSSLSGGWRMKLAMARAMLQKADILLLDEPTNHLDVINVAWVKNYINSLTNVTCIMVSHDSGFLRDCCTHILQIKNLKLKSFRGNLDAFIEHNPEAKAYFTLKASKLKFKYIALT
jgi:elongation factor 3